MTVAVLAASSASAVKSPVRRPWLHICRSAGAPKTSIRPWKAPATSVVPGFCSPEAERSEYRVMSSWMRMSSSRIGMFFERKSSAPICRAR